MERIRQSGKTIAFVPTMGYLHEGHISLMERGRMLAEILVASILVNPTQFGPGEDLSIYPRDIERDTALSEKAGVDFIFSPTAEELYPEGFETYISQEKLPEHLCGLSRPGHFRGVMTVVAKLFNIVKPHYAVFGEKDYQQLAVIRRMTRDLNFDTGIIGAPAVREPDGLAMSSRNSFLSPAQRESATALYRSLTDAREQVARGETDAIKIIEACTAAINTEKETDVEYIRICDPDNLEDLAVIDRPSVMAMAVRVGKTRLIDNVMLFPPGSGPG